MNVIDISKLNIRFPKDGFFTAFEWLIIDENKVVREGTLQDTKEIFKTTFYEPWIQVISGKSNEYCWIYFNVKWNNRDKNKGQKNEFKEQIYHLIAVELTLSE